MDMQRCRRCIYRSANMALYACDYYSFTGTTRKAVPPEECTHFVPGRRGDIAKGKAVLMPENMRKKRVSHDQIMELYRKGLSDAAAGRKLGISSQTVARWRRRNGYPPNGKPGPKAAGVKERREVEAELSEAEQTGEGYRYAPKVILATAADLREKARFSDEPLRFLLCTAADTVENLLRSADAMQGIIAKQHERIGVLTADVMRGGERVDDLEKQVDRLHRENFWLSQSPRPVLCRECRSGGMCQMERNFHSEGIAEPFCCRGKERDV